MEQQSFKRNVAYKVRIRTILDAQYRKVDGPSPNFLLSQDIEISRMNVIAAVIQKIVNEGNVIIVIEDGTGSVAARLFENLAQAMDIRPGDVVNIIGRAREYNGEKYVLIETIRKINPLWAKVRDLELPMVLSADEMTQVGYVSDDTVDSVDNRFNPQLVIMRKIRELDRGDGVKIESIVECGVKDFDEIVGTLLKQGEIFEVRPGRVKVLE